MLESCGSASTGEIGNNYVLGAGTAAPLMKYAGAGVMAGQFGGWTPIATETTASGYEVAWKLAGADQYTAWNTDSNGNYLGRSEERRVGKEGRSRWSPYH